MLWTVQLYYFWLPVLHNLINASLVGSSSERERDTMTMTISRGMEKKIPKALAGQILDDEITVKEPKGISQKILPKRPKSFSQSSQQSTEERSSEDRVLDGLDLVTDYPTYVVVGSKIAKLLSAGNSGAGSREILLRSEKART